MQTTSVMIQSLCVPCFNRCRYCLLAWNGKIEGAAWNRSVEIAERFLRELREQRPDLDSSFSFGYSMEHPDLKEAIHTLRRLGSPTADFLQCDGMKMRTVQECIELIDMLLSEGIKHLNFTIYGLSEYHDRFAGRTGDFELLMRMMEAADTAGLPFSTGIPLTTENAAQINELVQILKNAGSRQISLFIPHEEGRGKLLREVRLDEKTFQQLSPESQKLLNRSIFRTEGEWLSEPDPVKDEQRMIIISLRPENIDAYEKSDALSVVHEIEALDENYYASFPGFGELAEIYGDPEGDRFYRIRDLYYHYREQYALEHNLHVYDVTDERKSGSRRF